MNNITFYTHPWSRGRVTRWMLEECEANYQTEILEYDTSMKTEAYLAINPMGKVPALKYDGHIITENVAICTFLADQFPEKKLAPAMSDPLRGEYYRWLFFTAGPLEAAATAKQLGTLPSPEHYKGVGYGNFDDVVATLEQSLTGKDYICGETFSTADLYLSAVLNWYMEFDMLPKLSAFERYVKKHVSREASIRARQIDDELMKDYPMPQ